MTTSVNEIGASGVRLPIILDKLAITKEVRRTSNYFKAVNRPTITTKVIVMTLGIFFPDVS